MPPSTGALQGEPPPEWTRRPNAKDAVRAGQELREKGLDYDQIAAEAYWCEGTKGRTRQTSGRVVFVNSDPRLITLFVRFLEVAGVERDRLTYRLSIHESADVSAAERFWLDVTGAEPGQFSKPTPKRHNPKTFRKKVGEDYHGCLVISVLRSADLYQRIEGWARTAMCV